MFPAGTAAVCVWLLATSVWGADQFRYVCPDAEHTFAAKAPGVCSVCGKLLVADVPDGVKVEYVCPHHLKEAPSTEPGLCEVKGCSGPLQARQVQPAPKHHLKYRCPVNDHHLRYDRPGVCERCGKTLVVDNPDNLPLSYVCPSHADEVKLDKAGHCPRDDCWLFLEARLEQPKPQTALTYKCPQPEHEEEFDRPGRCPQCNMYLEAQSADRLRYVCPHPKHAYFLDRAGRCGVANCTFFLEGQVYVPPAPEKKPWYRTVAEWAKSLVGGRKK